MRITRISSCLVLAVSLTILSILIFGQSADSSSKDQEELEGILQKCADYSQKLANSALDFVCTEKIEDERFLMPNRFETRNRTIFTYSSVRPSRKNVYVYDYQLTRKQNKINEIRILIEENGKKKNEKNAQLKTALFFHENLIFGPVGLLSEFWQQYYDYEIVKREKFRGDKVIVIEATPKPYIKTDNLYGKIWAREDDFSIMKVEWEPTSVKNYELLEEYAQKLKAKLVIKLVAEYALEKNGIRFPSKYSVTEAYVFPNGRKFNRTMVDVTYEDYKFFTVETEVKY